MNKPAHPLMLELQEGFAGVRKDLSQARHLPGIVYTSDEIAALEKDRIFMKSWLCVGRVEELANPGDYMALRIVNEPIVVARDDDGKIVAYMNMCLHRGVEVAFGQGNARSFRCPYHAWNFDVGGNLIAAPWMKESGHDMSGSQLPRLKSAEWRGWIFVNFDADPEPFESYIAAYDKELWYYRTGDCKLAHKLVIDVNCNWKFITENLLDWYHASTVHAGTFGRYYKLGRDKLPAKLLPRGGSSIEFDAKSRSNDPNLPFPKLPWLADHDVFSAKGAIFPNINFWSGSDSLRMWHLWPTATDKTRAVCYILLPETSFATPDFDAKMKQYTSYVEAVATEDRAALESLQRGVSSPRYQPGVMSQLEVMVHHLMNHYVDALQT